MSRRNSNRRDGERSFLQKLAWTVLFGVVFGAGLITGQRLIANQSGTPLVSVRAEGTETEGSTSETIAESEEAGDEKPVFSFYDQLSEDDPPENTSDQKPNERGGETAPDSERSGDTKQKPARYTLQVSAHGSAEKARAKMRRLRKIGLDPYLVSAETPGDETYYRVRVGKFPSMEAARRLQREIDQKRGVETFVSPL